MVSETQFPSHRTEDWPRIHLQDGHAQRAGRALKKGTPPGRTPFASQAHLQ